MTASLGTLLYNIAEGVEGQPVARLIGSDTSMMVLVMVCFVFCIVALASIKPYATKLLKEIFFSPRDENWVSAATPEVWIALGMTVLDCLMLGILAVVGLNAFLKPLPLDDGYLLPVALMTACFAGYMLMKWILYAVVNYVFFSGNKNLHWMRFSLQAVSVEGILFFPAVVLLITVDCAIEKLVYYFAFVVFFVKFLTFYKCWNIFFKQKELFLQTFLYFCALEIVPVAVLGGILITIVEML